MIEVTMKKPEKENPEDDVLAAILKVKPTADMPRPGAQPSKHKGGKKEEKPTKR
jgi:hypothetical protein